MRGPQEAGRKTSSPQSHSVAQQDLQGEKQGETKLTRIPPGKSITQAVRHGSPGRWTWDDVEAARAEANATARPRGPSGPTPDESWNVRRPVTPSERRRFHASVQRLRTEEHGDNPTSKEEALSPREEAFVERQAIRRALEEHGYLLYARRRIPLPIRRHKTVRIT